MDVIGPWLFCAVSDKEFGGNPRGMLGGAYGANRAEAELVAQYGGGGGRTSGAASTGAGYGGNQQASVYGVMTGGRGPGGTLIAKSLYILCLLCS